MSDRSLALKQYRQDGYCVVRDLLPAGAVEAVLKDVDSIFARQLGRSERQPARYAGEETVRANMEELLALDVKRYQAAARHAAKLASLQALVVSQPILSLVAAFGLATPTVPTGPVLHIMGDRLKIPGSYFGFAPHQDWPSIQGGLDTITLWLPLMDVDARLFPLQLIPGSHTRGLWDGEVTENALEIRKGFVESDFVPAPARRGDVVMFTGFTVHRTALAGCSGLRIASSTRYENAEDPSFVARGYPCAYRRMVERTFIHRDFPTAQQVAAVFRAR